MERRFENMSGVAGASNSGNMGEVSSSASSVTSAASSTASPESSPNPSANTMRSSEQAPTTLAIDPSGNNNNMVGREIYSPTSAGVTDSGGGSIGSGDGPRSVEPINPFETAMQHTSNRSLGSHSSGVSAPTGSMTENIAASPMSPDRSTSHHISSSPTSPMRETPHSTPQHQVNSVSFQRGYPQDDDDDTEPSSAVTSAQDPHSDGHDTGSMSSGPYDHGNSITRFIETTRRRIGTTSTTTKKEQDDPAHQVPDVDDDMLGENPSGTLICGYLEKLGRNGKWQLRWFETDGECLSYYKNEKRTKVLATLDLEKVGSIVMDPMDASQLSFNIQVLGRLYHLRTDSKASCKDWVITLNRVKEARMNQGNVKLISMPFHQPVDFLDMPAQSDDFVTPRVVVLANRQRTRGVQEEEEMNHLIQLEENTNHSPAMKPTQKPEKRVSAIGSVVLARWTKRRSSISRLRSKLTQWARSLRRMNRTSDAAAGLDRHVHPPGHDDHHLRKRSTAPATTAQPVSSQKKKEGLSSWIGKETSLSSRAPPAPDNNILSPEVTIVDSNRPRKDTAASEADLRVLS